MDVAEGGNEVHHSVGGPDTSPQQHVGNGHLNSTQSNQINVDSRRSKKEIPSDGFAQRNRQFTNIQEF